MSWSINFTPNENSLSGYFNVYCDGNLTMKRYILARPLDDDVLIFGNQEVPITFKIIKDFIDSLKDCFMNRIVDRGPDCEGFGTALDLDSTDYNPDGQDLIWYYNKYVELGFDTSYDSNGMKFKLYIDTPELKDQVIIAFEKFLEHFNTEHKKKLSEYKKIQASISNKHETQN